MAELVVTRYLSPHSPLSTTPGAAHAGAPRATRPATSALRARRPGRLRPLLGRPRPGVVGACLLSLLQPGLDAPAVLEAVQLAYDSRSGAGAMPSPLKRSPQTEGQRSFVRSFVSAVRASRRYLNDLEMSDAGGMPRGYL
eukprot:scaffold48111_cov72-Phaeocystis_antarctica.AAC.5